MCLICHENSTTVVTVLLYTHANTFVCVCCARLAAYMLTVCACDWWRCSLAEAAALINLVLLKQSKCKLLELSLSLPLSPSRSFSLSPSPYLCLADYNEKRI